MLEFKINEIDVDLIYAQIPFQNIPKNFDILNNEIISKNKEKRSIYGLAYLRSLLKIVEITQNKDLFVSLMRILKIWLKNRLIYSNIAGYLSGASLAVMSAKICQIYPNATLTFALKQFFIIYRLWGWPQPLLIQKLDDTNNEFKNTLEFVEPWNLKKEISEIDNDSEDSNDEIEEENDKLEGNNGNIMSVIMPGFPEQNTTYNVNKFTFKIINKEIKRAYKILQKMNYNDEKNIQLILNELIEKINWETSYEHFILILCKNEEKNYCDKQKVFLRTYLYNWENDKNNLIKESHYLINVEKDVYCNFENKSDSLIICKLWIIGINLNSEM
ncbi:PAP_central domain-containing protein, partial [Meloidogyne graminicola]